MLRLLPFFIICTLLITPLQAADVLMLGKDSQIVFLHKGHTVNLGGCTECHGTQKPGPIPGYSPDWAHTTCIGCHNENKAGPVECSGCHTLI